MTDPPYGIGFKYASHDDARDKWFGLMNAVIPALRQIAPFVVMPCCQITHMGWWYENHKPDWLIAWNKGSPGHCSHVGFNDWEPLLVYGKRKGICMHDHFYAQPTAFDNGHPCPKPIEWAAWLIERASKPGDTIVDGYAGSGTTCVAAKMLGRNFIGIDISEDYCDIARKRLEAVDTGVPVKERDNGQMPMFTK